jgi:hypothetical protein
LARRHHGAILPVHVDQPYLDEVPPEVTRGRVVVVVGGWVVGVVVVGVVAVD